MARSFVLYMNGLFENIDCGAGKRPDNSLGVGLIKPSTTSEKANQEALHWLIALQEDPDDDALLARFQAWLRSCKENEQAWGEAQRVWNVLGEVGDATAGVRPEPGHAGSQARQRRGWRLRPRHLVSAVAGAAAICLAVVFQPAVSIWLAADYSTSTAEVREIRLEDGSTVHLAADSALAVAFEPGMRRVRLLSGEAYFEVQPDAKRPFRVGTGDVDTTVLGTAFGVRMMAGGVAVAVNHGRVGVAYPQAGQGLDEPLEAGDWVHVDWDGKIERGNDDPELVGSWRTGLLVVKDRPVADVVDEIRRYYRGMILLADGNLAEQRVTGVYDLRQPVEAIRALAQVHGANTHQIGTRLVVVSRY